MMSITNGLKESVIFSRYFLAKLMSGRQPNRDELNKLYSDGMFIKKSVLSTEKCKELRNEIDKLLTENSVNVWRDNERSDERIYGADLISDIIKNALPVNEFKTIGEQYLNKKLKHHFILAGRLSFVDGNLGSGGGWHRDSPFTHQFKAITYLSDVHAGNGPFQYLKSSHLTLNKVNLPFKLNKYRFTNTEVESILPESDLIECTGNAGDACLADVRGIHRGTPIKTGQRYALTIYFFETEKQLNDFKNLMQK